MSTHCSILAWRSFMDRGVWRAAVHGVEKSWTQLSNLACTPLHFTGQKSEAQRNPKAKRLLQQVYWKQSGQSAPRCPQNTPRVLSVHLTNPVCGGRRQGLPQRSGSSHWATVYRLPVKGRSLSENKTSLWSLLYFDMHVHSSIIFNSQNTTFRNSTNVCKWPN